jgi:hypothetical protein
VFIQAGAEVKIIQCSMGTMGVLVGGRSLCWQDAIAWINAGREHHASFEGKLIVTQPHPQLSSALVAMTTEQAPVMGKKAQGAAYVETQQGNVQGREVSSCPENGAIPSQNNC